MRIRKQVYELVPKDLEAHPIWEFALDEESEEGQDEATVRPWKGELPLDPSDGMFVVRAVFELADGTKLGGYLTPPVGDDRSIGILQPTIVTARGQVGFWWGASKPKVEEIRGAYAKLGRTSSAMFPCRFASDVPIAGGPVAGSVKGFMRFRSLDDQTLIAMR